MTHRFSRAARNWRPPDYNTLTRILTHLLCYIIHVTRVFFSPPIYLHYQKYFSFYMSSAFVSSSRCVFFFLIVIALSHFFLVVFSAHNMNVFVFPPLSHFFLVSFLLMTMREKRRLQRSETDDNKREREQKMRLAYDVRSSDYMRVTIDIAAVSRGSLCAKPMRISSWLYTESWFFSIHPCVCVCVWCAPFIWCSKNKTKKELG